MAPDGPRPLRDLRHPALAPCAGTVAVSVDGLPDMPVPEMDREHLPGNFVVIDCGGFAVALAHMRQGSVVVEEGDRVRLATRSARWATPATAPSRTCTSTRSAEFPRARRSAASRWA